MSAVLFGSISTLVDTSEWQRQAFNEAFTEHGLDWVWGRADYRAMLQQSGGRSRVAEYARERGVEADATAVHETKSRIFQQKLAEAPVTARPGVLDTVRVARAAGLRLALVTTTAADNLAALFAALDPNLTAADFDLVLDSGTVATPKPDPAAYLTALRELDERPTDCVAIEDNVGGLRAAGAAGLACVAFPNENTAEHDFGAATAVVRELDADALTRSVPQP